MGLLPVEVQNTTVVDSNTTVVDSNTTLVDSNRNWLPRLVAHCSVCFNCARQFGRVFLSGCKQRALFSPTLMEVNR